jgi:hypothetical protein
MKYNRVAVIGLQEEEYHYIRENFPFSETYLDLKVLIV